MKTDQLFLGDVLSFLESPPVPWNPPLPDPPAWLPRHDSLCCTSAHGIVLLLIPVEFFFRREAEECILSGTELRERLRPPHRLPTVDEQDVFLSASQFLADRTVIFLDDGATIKVRVGKTRDTCALPGQPLSFTEVVRIVPSSFLFTPESFVAVVRVP